MIGRRRAVAAAASLGILFSACTANHPKSRYLLAERLWTDGKYAAAVTEFERVSQRDPSGRLGL